MPYIQSNKTRTYWNGKKAGQKDQTRFSITLPKEIVKLMKWERGDELVFDVSKITGNIEIRKAGKEERVYNTLLLELVNKIDEEAEKRFQKLKEEGELVKRKV